MATEGVRLFAMAFDRRAVPVWFERDDRGDEWLVGACGWVGLSVPIVVEYDAGECADTAVALKLKECGYSNVTTREARKQKERAK